MKKLRWMLVFCCGVMLLSACLPQFSQAVSQGESTEPAVMTTEPQESGVGGEVGEEPTATAAVVENPVASAEVITPANVARLMRIGQVSLQSPASRLRWSLDGSSIGALASDSLSRFSFPDLTLLGLVKIEPPFVLLDYSPDGDTMAATSDWSTIHLLNSVDGSLIRTLTPPTMFTAAFFSPDGRYLVVNSTDEIAATLWDVESGQPMRSFSGFETAAPVYSVFYSSNGLYLIWLARAQVQLSGINSGQMGIPFFHEDFVTAVALNPQGTLLAVSTDGMVGDTMLPFVKLWDPVTGEERGTLMTPGMAQSLAFSPDGMLLAAGPWIWDPSSATQVFDLSDPAGISDCVFSPDGKTLALLNNNGILSLWQVAAP